ncbi:MAG: hypothetical protein HQL32_09335 [Planctomycetes bacterium]|nr:hypothetical protein [Planctomycetota bacterium]
MLIWYANIPEETAWFIARGWGADGVAAWFPISGFLVIVRFVIPFFLLLSRHAKMNTKTLGAAAVIIMVGQLMDLYQLIYPHLYPQQPPCSIDVYAVLFLALGMFFLFISNFMKKFKMIPTGDPNFKASTDFHL